ncbi:hypothetical protein AbraIFM66950_001570 [Aspergillus brasiliensis]|nr:hypothetical protein AbraIFM66950_001570 [Aspergillus brasiliensis]
MGINSKAEVVKEAFLKLSTQHSLSEIDRKQALKVLGKGKQVPVEKKAARALHEALTDHVGNAERTFHSEVDVREEVIDRFAEPGKLEYLLTVNRSGETILHHIFSEIVDGALSFDKLKSLIRLLLLIDPKLPSELNTTRQTPLYTVMVSDLDYSCKQQIVDFLCEDGPGADAAFHSLILTSTTNDHALHNMIFQGVQVDFSRMKKTWDRLEKLPDRSVTSALQARNSQGLTCLHLALSQPFTSVKLKWAEDLAGFKPSLLGEQSKGSDMKGLAPLQYFYHIRNTSSGGGVVPKTARRDLSDGTGNKLSNSRGSSKPEVPPAESSVTAAQLDGMENKLKRVCLLNFDAPILDDIIYTKNNWCQIHFELQEGDEVSIRSLSRLAKHLRPDKLLNRVYIPKVNVRWDDDGGDDTTASLRSDIQKWSCRSRTDYCLVFHWLKKQAQVGKVLEIAVDDLPTDHSRPHSDEAIHYCLQDLQIEVWNWKRHDIPTTLLLEVAKDSLRILYLYCSGLNAVLESWSSKDGLPRLRKLEKLRYELDQGLEPVGTIHKYKEAFEERLKKNFNAVNGRELTVEGHIVHPHSARHAQTNRDIKVKKEGEDGYEEQEWLRHMDGFAARVAELDGNPGEIRVALIDDGVRSNIAGLDDSIAAGKSFATTKSSASTRSSNYNTSQFGHGTVMALCIRRMCPKVRLYVARVDGKENSRRGVSFSIASINQALKWAIRQEVHIISMSWAIEKEVMHADGEQARIFRTTMRKAVEDHQILLFCANPDKGSAAENDTYPTKIDPALVFCVGAARRDGVPWNEINPADKSCDLLLPGVELSMPEESSVEDSKGLSPDEYRKYNGSSLSCALAAGLAAILLHVANTVREDSEQWKGLRSKNGMEKAFQSLGKTTHGWIPVERSLGNSLLGGGSQGLMHFLKYKLVPKMLGQESSI